MFLETKTIKVNISYFLLFADDQSLLAYTCYLLTEYRLENNRLGFIVLLGGSSTGKFKPSMQRKDNSDETILADCDGPIA